MNTKLTDCDKQQCTDTWAKLQAADCEECTDCDDPSSADCFNSETIMTSIGYVEVYNDGEVIAYGVVIFDASEDA